MIEPEQSALDGVAIVGMAGRFPGARTPAELWDNLCAGRESVRWFSDDELLRAGVPAAALEDPLYVRARAVLDDPEVFDPEFFGLTPREAALTDPQHRIFLECCWEALEDAGLDPAAAGGTMGVFAGCSLNTYVLGHVLAGRGQAAQFLRGYQVDGYPVAVGNDKDYLATRVAYALDLRGPAVTVQTACSTSLVAVCQAVAALNAYQCDSVLAGGVSVTFPQCRGYRYEEGSIASADGHCRVFDASARGTVFGAGCGVVVLKRLADAVAEGHEIYAVIKGAAVNNDGRARQSFMAPSPDGQAGVIELAHALAGVSADTISYVEAHGTGTPLGDPIEVTGLTQAFRATTDRRQFCWLGSVKANIGHLECAAGVTGLIKTALALRHRELPATLHYREANPAIDFPSTPFRVVAERTPWEGVPLPRRAGVSSFGVGATNAHVVLEEAPQGHERAPDTRSALFVVSARTETALKRATERLAARLEEGAGEAAWLGDAAFTLQTGRRGFEHRMAVVASDAAAAAARLAGSDAQGVIRGRASRPDRKVAFLFPGQGAQQVGMGRELWETEPVFREAFEACRQLFREPLGIDLPEILYPEPGREAEAQRRLDRTHLAQPAIFSVEYALARQWMSWGIEPSALLGHSVGEYVAAVLAGVMSLETAAGLLSARARLMEAQPSGAMLSVRLSEAEARAELSGKLAVAVVNSPRNTVVAGPRGEVRALAERLEAKGIACKPLATSHAFHSPMMDPVLKPFAAVVGGVSLSDAEIPIVSTMSGRWIEPGDWRDANYWPRQVREAVRFSDAAAAMVARPEWVLLEVGPGQTLTLLTKQQTGRSDDQPVVASLPAPGKPGERDSMLLALGTLWTAGVAPAWERLHAGVPRRRVSLPCYPFERRRCWIEAPPEEGAVVSADDVPGAEDTSSVAGTILCQLDQMLDQLDILGATHCRRPESAPSSKAAVPT